MILLGRKYSNHNQIKKIIWAGEETDIAKSYGTTYSIQQASD